MPQGNNPGAFVVEPGTHTQSPTHTGATMTLFLAIASTGLISLGWFVAALAVV